MPSRLKDFATAVVAVVEPETSALTVAQLMRQHHIGALVVVDAQEKSKPVGIVTDRDLVLSLMAEGLDPTLFTAGDIMSIELVVANAELDAMEAVQLMRTQRVRRLVLVDDKGALAGIGWGMNPLHLVGEHLRTGRLVELVTDRPLDVPLYWQVAKLPLPELERLSRSVHKVANALLVH